MSDYSNITGAIKTMLEAVTSIGIVHDHFRYVDNDKDLRELFQSGDNYKGVMFRQTAVTPATEEVAELKRTFALIVIHQVDDENNSEKTIQEMVESITDKFQDATVYGYEVDGIGMINFEDTEYGSILVHMATMQLTLIQNNY